MSYRKLLKKYFTFLSSSDFNFECLRKFPASNAPIAPLPVESAFRNHKN